MDEDLAIDKLREVLEEKGVVAAGPLDLSVILWEENLDAPKDGSTWATFLVNHDGKVKKVGAQGGARGGQRELDGLIEYILYMPEKTGSGPLTKLGNKLANYFDCEQFIVPPYGEVTIEPMSVNRLKNDGRGYARVSVWGYFRYRFLAGRVA